MDEQTLPEQILPEQILPEQMPAEPREKPRHQRGEPRESMLVVASLRALPGGATHPVRIRNISAGGFMADCAMLLEKDQEVEVELRNIGWVAGHAAWADGVRIGVAFVDPIDPQALRRRAASPESAKMLVPRPGLGERRPGLKIK